MNDERESQPPEKGKGQKSFEIALASLIGAGISFVSIQMQSIIARSNSTVVSIDVATAQLGINPIWLTWERLILVLLLIFLAGWMREGYGAQKLKSDFNLPEDDIVETLPAIASTTDAIAARLQVSQSTISHLRKKA